MQKEQIQSGKLEEILNRIWKQSGILGDGREMLEDLKTNIMHCNVPFSDMEEIEKLEMNTK